MPLFLWPSIEVYVINLLIGAAVFFCFRWLFKKFIADKKRRKWTVWIATIIVTPIIYIGLVFAMIASWYHIPKRDFDKESWFLEKDLRFEMKENIVESKILEGKNQSEIIQLIGEPDWRDTVHTTWTYDLGMGGGGLGFLFHTLKVQFENDKVVKVESLEIRD